MKITVTLSLLFLFAVVVSSEPDAKCKALQDKWNKYAEDEVREKWLMKEKCAQVKCKPLFKHFPQYWSTIKKHVDAVLAEIKKMGGFDIKKLPGTCAKFQSDVNRVFWKEIDKIVDDCLSKPDSPGQKDLGNENLCNKDFNKDKAKPAQDCVKGRVVPLALEIVAVRMEDFKKCEKEMTDKYCNEPNLGKWKKFNLVDAFKDRKIFGPLNIYNLIDEYLKDCQPHPK